MEIFIRMTSSPNWVVNMEPEGHSPDQVISTVWRQIEKGYVLEGHVAQPAAGYSPESHRILLNPAHVVSVAER